jgi:hypothetical protein
VAVLLTTPVRGPCTLRPRYGKSFLMPVSGLCTLRPKAETVRRHHACQEALYLETALAISRAEPRRNNTISMPVRGPCTLRRVACPHVLMPVKRLDILRQQVPVLLTMPVRGPCTLRQSESSALVGSNACQEALYLETMCCPHFAAFYHHARQGALYPETVSPWLSPHMITMPVIGLYTLRPRGVPVSRDAKPLSFDACQGALYPETTPTDPLWFPATACSQCLSMGFIH